MTNGEGRVLQMADARACPKILLHGLAEGSSLPNAPLEGGARLTTRTKAPRLALRGFARPCCQRKPSWTSSISQTVRGGRDRLSGILMFLILEVPSEPLRLVWDLQNLSIELRHVF